MDRPLNATHAPDEVFNQSTPLADYDLFASHRALASALSFNGLPEGSTTRLRSLGRLLGTSSMQQHARLANVHPPRLHTHDRFGHRIDQVEFHPGYHALMEVAVSHGLHGTPWRGGRGAHVERAAAFMMFNELEASVMCPVSMTYAGTPALRANQPLFDAWFPNLGSTRYDPRMLALGEKTGATLGMGMTEKQGGSDVRAITTIATFMDGTPWGRRYRLVGHKWFFSAPMSDAFLVLAQAPAGLSCFFVPRVTPDWLTEGDRATSTNAIRIVRLKDKLGNRANASAEVEFVGAHGWLIGEEGKGIRQILEMGTLTRIDCALGTAGLMRQALSLALHHTARRSAFGKPLIGQSLMKNVLADLALESEASMALALRLARSVEADDNTHEASMRRLLTPVAKYWICKRGSHFAQEAMECLGGNGYVEEGGEGVMARIYREMPVNSIWEGAGNVMALDLMRALRPRPGASGNVVHALEHELAPARGANQRFDDVVASLLMRLSAAAEADEPIEFEARRLAQQTALCVQAALLYQHAPKFVFDGFCVSRFSDADVGWGGAFGSLSKGVDADALINRARLER